MQVDNYICPSESKGGWLKDPPAENPQKLKSRSQPSVSKVLYPRIQPVVDHVVL